MSDSKNIPNPPRGLCAIPWRLPIWLYRWKLGWLMGNRFLLLNHTGRVSGLPRQAVLEVVKYDQGSNTYYVASGFGSKADWFLNIKKTPEITIWAAGQEIEATAAQLAESEATSIFQEYHQKHPKALQGLSRLIGYQLNTDETEMLAFFSQNIPVVAFYPK